eukprot:6187603-Pleurochrysis_carterae.AAC.2
MGIEKREIDTRCVNYRFRQKGLSTKYRSVAAPSSLGLSGRHSFGNPKRLKLIRACLHICADCAHFLENAVRFICGIGVSRVLALTRSRCSAQRPSARCRKRPSGGEYLRAQFLD